MTEYFSEEGESIPVTIVSVPPITVTRVFEKSKDGYNSVQVGSGVQKKERITKSRAGAMNGAFYKNLKEFRLKSADKTEAKVGDVIDVTSFNIGDKIMVSSVSKGKGFQGVVKRHGFHGGPRTHGQKHSEREPGSIGGGLRTHVPKGMRMAGRMGGETVTVQNLKVVGIEAGDNLLLIEGAIPGCNRSIVVVRAKGEFEKKYLASKTKKEEVKEQNVQS